MEKRTFSFLITTTIVFVVLISVQAIFFPPKVENENGDVAQVEQQDKQADEDEKSDEGDSQADTETSQETEANENEQGDEEEEAVVELPELPRNFVNIGSLAKDSNFRMLACFDTRGATIRRVEMNSRLKNGRLRYRDVEKKYGYIGELELANVDQGGCEIRSVGEGTPAYNATPIDADGLDGGLAVGDQILQFNDKPVVGVSDFNDMLAATNPGDEISLKVKRSSESGNSATIQFNIKSTRWPMQVIKPLPTEKLRSNDLMRRAFQLTLKHQSEAKEGTWLAGGWQDIDERMRKANWAYEVIENQDNDVVEFTFDIPPSDGNGGIQVVKRYRVLKSENGTTFDRTYHIDLEFEFRNLGTESRSVNFELAGPTGTPIEGWWYQQKIHGSTWAIGRMAGARDIVCSTNEMPYQFVAGPRIVKDFEADEKSLIIGPDEKVEGRQIRYLAVDTQYFAVALLPKSPDFSCYSMFGSVASVIPEKKKEKRTTDITFILFSNQIELPAAENGQAVAGYSEQFEIFVGPKDPKLLKIYGLQNTRTFGWFAMFSRPLCWLLGVFHSITFGVSYALSIIMLTFLVRSLMIPISRKAALNAQMMQHLQPEFKKISEKYKDDIVKSRAAQQELMRKYNFNPLGGCMLMFLQLPIFIGLYRGLSVDIALRDQPLIPGLGWCSNLAAPDMLFDWSGWMPAFIASETGWLGPTFNLLPVLTIVLFLAQQKMFMPPATDDQQKMMQRMMTFMMIFMGFIFFKVPAGLCVYFITSSIWGIMERKLLPKPKLKDVPDFSDDGDSSSKKKNDEPTESGPLRNEKEIELRKRRDKERRKKLKERS